VDIFNFFNYRIGLDGRNFQIGALHVGTLGIGVGEVLGPFWGGGVALCEIPDSNPAIEKTGIFY
jgi:hypothetical protein